MKYLIIPISEIDSRIEELEKELYKDIKYNEIKKLQEKGEIVEIEEIKEEDWWNKREFFATLFKKGYKLIKTIKQ